MLGFSLQLKRLMPRAVHLVALLLAKSVVFAASLRPVAAAGASHYSWPAGLAQFHKRQEGLRGLGGVESCAKGPGEGGCEKGVEKAYPAHSP